MITVSLYRALRVVIAMTIGTVVSAALTLSQSLGRMHLGVVEPTIPFHFIIIGAGFVGVLTASIVAGTLSRERSYLALTWTRPSNRIVDALTAIGIDFMVIIICDCIALAAILGSMEILGLMRFFLVAATDIAQSAVLMIGVAWMWYGVVAACTAPLARSALVYAAYPVFFVLVFANASHLAQFVGLDWLVEALSVLNPLAYILDRSQIEARGYGVSIAMIFSFALAGVAIAAFGWSRREATR